MKLVYGVIFLPQVANLIIKCAILILSLNKTIFIYLIIIAFCSLFFSKKMSDKISPAQKKYNDSLGENAEVLMDIFESPIILKVFKIEPFMKKLFSKSSKSSTEELFRLKKKNTLVTFSNDSFAWVIQIGTYILGALLINQKKMSFAELIAITQASATITTPIFWFSNTLADFYSSKDIRKKLMKIIDKTDAVGEYIHIEEIQSIKLKNVEFDFLDNSKIGPINFKITRGNKYVMIGKNGSGKSTIYSTLMMNFNNYSGEVFVNDQNIKNINIADYVANITVVTQKNKLYKGSVLDNICSFSEKVNFDKIDKIKQLFINENKDFINKSVENLSGGQQQLVTIARALYKDSSFFILDEPFASLDKSMENHVLDYLLGLDNKTILITIHHYDSLLLEKFDDVIHIGG